MDYYCCIIVPVKNRVRFTLPFLKSLSNQTITDFKVILIDDGSNDGTSKAVRLDFPDVDIIEGNGEWWWTKSVVEGIKFSVNKYNAKYILLLNDDLIVNENYLDEFVKKSINHPRLIQCSLGADIDNPKLMILPGNLLNRFTGIVKSPPDIESTKKSNMCFPARGLWIPVGTFEKIRFNYEDFPQNAADYDFTLSAKKAGYDIDVNTKALIYYHAEETSENTFYTELSMKNLWKYLTNIKSTCNIKISLRFVNKHCYAGFRKMAFIIVVVKCTLGYLRRWIKYSTIVENQITMN